MDWKISYSDSSDDFNKISDMDLDRMPVQEPLVVIFRALLREVCRVVF